MSAFTLFRQHKTPEGGWGAYAWRKLSGHTPLVTVPEVDHAIEQFRDEVTSAANKLVGDHGGQFSAAIQAQVTALGAALATMAETAVGDALGSAATVPQEDPHPDNQQT